MCVYYCELKNRAGRSIVEASNDTKAISLAKERAVSLRDELSMVYRESDTENGLPFVVVFDT